jgi:hypothetical protein
MSDTAAVPAELPESLRPLVGLWRGEGHGEYPTIASFDYFEEVSFTTVPGKPFLVYSQKTRAVDDGRPLHAESGYWRSPSSGRIEVVVAHPFGAVEVLEGSVFDGEIRLASVAAAVTSTAKLLDETQREFDVEADTMTYRVAMAAVGQPLTHHLAATLHRALS